MTESVGTKNSYGKLGRDVGIVGRWMRLCVRGRACRGRDLSGGAHAIDNGNHGTRTLLRGHTWRLPGGEPVTRPAVPGKNEYVVEDGGSSRAARCSIRLSTWSPHIPSGDSALILGSR